MPNLEEESVKWFRKAAEQGYAPAQSCLGTCYDNGNGVPQDYAEALRWFRKATEQGDPEGQANLGLMYADGKGRKFDDVVQSAQAAAVLVLVY